VPPHKVLLGVIRGFTGTSLLFQTGAALRNAG
jgi:hypothetical protein